MSNSISFTIYGLPQPQGSMRAFLPRGFKRPIITSDNEKLKPWRQEIAGTAQIAVAANGGKPYADAVRVDATFYFPKPKSTKKSITRKATRPDCEKLARGLFDALTGIVYRDDAQVCECYLLKAFGTPARTEVTVTDLGK